MSFLSRIEKCRRVLIFFRLLAVFSCQPVFSQTTDSKGVEKAPTPEESRKGKAPIIIIPGLIGSELVNKNTEETVWFSIGRSKDDDMRLPVSPNIQANKDNLVAGDIIRNLKYLKFLPETEIYAKLAGSLVAPGGYKEGKWDAPDADGFEDTYYVLPYDWRLDNVENARLLVRKITALKTALKHPNLKFNIVAHSMGGLIARYAARYGDADIPAGDRLLRPTWAGAKHINKIFLIGTPNEGSFGTLDSLLNGFSLGLKGINLPFVQNISKFDLFTIPSVYQLLPHQGTARIFDGDLKPLKIDLFNAATWEKYGWAAYDDPKFAKEFTPAEQQSARAYLRAVLARAKRFQEAIDVGMTAKSPVSLYLIGADCKPTIDGMIVYRDTKKNKWEMVFSPESFKQSDGTKITAKQVKDLLYINGDGVVTTRSLLTSSSPGARLRKDYRTALYVDDIAFTCDTHNQLTGNAEVQRKLFNALNYNSKSLTAGNESEKTSEKPAVKKMN